MSEHSEIGASGAYRWIRCPGSVRLGRLCEKRTSGYASEGTAAHELGEKCLRSGRNAAEFIGEIIKADGLEFTVDGTMAVNVQLYVDTIRGDLAVSGGTLNVEQSFSLEWLFPGMFGRNDASIVPVVPFEDLRIYDYKNGRKAVSAEQNEQCMYYALGAIGKDNPMFCENAICKIIQPNAYGKDAVDIWTIPVPELYEWGYDVLRPAAQATQKPDAPCIPGGWCTFCPATALCKAQAEAAIAVFDICPPPTPLTGLPDIAVLTPTQIGRAVEFFTSENFTSWVKALAAEELAMLQRGADVPGRKLVETISKGDRKWAEEAIARVELAWLGPEIWKQTLLSPKQLEDLMRSKGIEKKKRDGIINPLVAREEKTSAKVVSENDSRPALKSLIEMFK